MFIPDFLRRTSFAIDLGNNNTLLTDKEQILLTQPSYIVFNKQNHSVKAVGEEAYAIFEKNHSDLQPVKPLKCGVIADHDSALAMIKAMVRKISTQSGFRNGFDEIISGVPYSTTEVERRALRDTLDQFNSRKRFLVVEPLAAAVGMGLNIQEPEGKMIIDIGGGITEIVVISLSGVAVFQSIKTAGDTFTENIQDHLRKRYNLQVGWKTAERVKVEVGAVMNELAEAPSPVMVKGKDIREGLPVSKLITHCDVVQMLEQSFRTIEDHIRQALEICPPELAADIYGNGIFVTGGGAMLRGLQQRLEQSIQIPVHLDQQPLLSVGKGISAMLRNTSGYKSVLF